MRLDLDQFGPLDHPQTLHAVRGSALEQILKPTELVLAGRDDQLARRLAGNAAFIAIADHFRRSGDAQLGFQRTGRVVDAGMDHAAVVAGLMLSDLALFFEHDDLGARAAAQYLARGRQSENAGAGHHDVAVPGRGLRGRNDRLFSCFEETHPAVVLMCTQRLAGIIFPPSPFSQLHGGLAIGRYRKRGATSVANHSMPA